MKADILTVMIIVILVLNACGSNKEETRNIEQLYKENGIPVKVKVVQPEVFSRKLPYTAVLTGIRQSSASAMIGGRIERINVEVGDYVRKDSVLMEFPEDAPAAQYQQAKSAYELARSTYERMKNLYEIGGISRQELDAAETQFEVSAANWDAAQQMLKVRAPIDGYVTSIKVRETDGVEMETVLATIAQTDRMKARVWVTESEICDIQVGNRARAFWNDIVLEGSVTQVAMAMDMDHNAFGVDIVFDNRENLCKSGVTGDIHIITYENPTALMVDRKTVQKDKEGKYVYRVVSGSAERVYIETGFENSGFEVLDGVSIGDSIIVEGLNLVSSGDKVLIVD